MHGVGLDLPCQRRQAQGKILQRARALSGPVERQSRSAQRHARDMVRFLPLIGVGSRTENGKNDLDATGCETMGQFQ